MGTSIENLLARVPVQDDQRACSSTSTESKNQINPEKPDSAGSKPVRHVQIHGRNEANYPEIQRILKGETRTSPNSVFSDPYTSISKVKLSSCIN